MIIDSLDNAYLYFGLNEKIKKALMILQETDFSNYELGKYEIDENEIFFMVQEYQLKPIAKGRWEAHKKYIDLQYIVKGTETMGFANIKSMTLSEEYNAENDIFFLDGEGDSLQVEKGTFVIFMPADVHMPAVTMDNSNSTVKKVVFKISID